jgi:cation transport ATPase
MLLAVCAALCVPQPVFAAEKVVRLSIPACNCAIANAIVAGIIEDVPGVRHARVNGMDASATVFYDNATTSADGIKKALAKASIQVDNVSVPLDAQGCPITK